MGKLPKTVWNRKGNGLGLQAHDTRSMTWLSYPALSKIPGIVHGFSTRIGGVSEGHLSSMNLGFSCGDDPENVRENFRRIAAAIGFYPESMVFSQQTHTTNVRKVTREDRGKGYDRPLDYTDVDGLITNVPGLVLTTFYADCVPLYFVDPVHYAVGLSHSGWRGTVGKIGKVTVERMEEEYGSRPQELIAAIGPSICQDCYEVSEDVIEMFAQNFAPEVQKKLYYRKENGKYQLNLWEANRIVLQEAGIPAQNIHVTDICTCCNHEQLFSHRASQGKRGSLAAFLGICE